MGEGGTTPIKYTRTPLSREFFRPIIDEIKERFSDGIFNTAMVVKIKFLKSEIFEMKTHMEDDD